MNKKVWRSATILIICGRTFYTINEGNDGKKIETMTGIPAQGKNIKLE